MAIHGMLESLIAAPGAYRVTFSFDDPSDPSATLNTHFDAATAILQLAEEVIAAVEPGGGGTAVVDASNNLSYIDVVITPSGKGGGGGRK